MPSLYARRSDAYDNHGLTTPGFGAIAFYSHVHVQGLLAFSLRAVFALLTLGLCYVAGKRFGAKQLAFAILALGMVYLMLFNSRTENNDYIMVMPAIGFTFAYAVIAKERWQIIFHSVVLVLLMRPVATPHAVL